MSLTRAATVVALTACAIAGATVGAAAPAAAATDPPGRILYTSGLGAREFNNLYSVLPDRTGRRTEVTNLDTRWPGSSVAYSADLRTVVYTRADQSVWTARADGTGARQIIARPDPDADPYCERVCGLTAPNFSPDGRQIASLEPYDGGQMGRLIVLNVDGTNVRVFPGVDARATMVGYGRVSWSPDGTRVTYAAGPREADRSAIYVTDVGTGATRQLTDAGSFKLHAAWSPDGRQIAYSGTVPLAFGQLAYDLERDLYTVRVDDRRVLRVTNTPTRVENRPVWSPDSRWLAYDREPLVNPGVKPAVRLIGATGTGDRPLDVNGQAYGWLR
ncbi:MAG TPA: hypothetical protein VF755_05085 [Catenuloplanes sp.]